MAPEEPHLPANPVPEATSPHTHGYWGPLPGESVLLYERLGVPAIYENIQPHVPRGLRGDFNLAKGTEAKADWFGHELPQPEPPTPPSRRERIEAMITFTKKNELIHLGGLAVFGVLGGLFIKYGDPVWTGVGALLEATNIPVNVYPIMLQRYMRLRGYRVLDAIRRHDKGHNAAS